MAPKKLNNLSLICVVGDQPLPSILFTKWVETSAVQEYIFLTTDLMESRNKLRHLLDSLNLDKPHKKIIIPGDDIAGIHQILDKKLGNSSDKKYKINLTSGSKLMSIAIFQYFTQPNFTNQSKIYYLPIKQNAFIQIFPYIKYELSHFDVQYRIPVHTYLTSYGIKIDDCKTSQSLYMPPAFTINFMQEQLKAPREEIKKLRTKYNEKKSKSEFYITPSPSLQEFLNKAHYPIAKDGNLNKADMHYLIGGWFEEWTFHRIKQKYELSDNDILCNVSISRLNEAGESVNNECDVLFTYQNTLHVVECKTGLPGKHLLKPAFYEVLYKLNTLKNEFGQRVNAEFYTLSDKLRNEHGQYKSFIEERSRLYRIKVLDQADLILH